MTKLAILQQATKITLNRKSLWLFGIFLTSAFNLHTWYAGQWLSEARLFSRLSDVFLEHNSILLIGLGLTAVVMGFVIINFSKLMFLGLVHNCLHDVAQRTCPLCIELTSSSIAKYLWNKKIVLVHTIGASVITASVTMAIVGGFRFYSIHSQYSLWKALLLLISVLFALVLISWWNLLTALFIFWHRQNLAKAAMLSADLISSKFRSIAGITVLATIVFLSSIAAATAVLWQLPMLLGSPPEFLLPGPAVAAWQIVVSALAAGIFLLWLLLNNVWFNVVMISWFNNQVVVSKTPESLQNLKFNRPSFGIPLQQSIDKSQKIL